MDAYEATRVVFSRIQGLDPDNAAKIMGMLLIQDHGEKEMIRLAFGPEALLQSVVLKARKELGVQPQPLSPAGGGGAGNPFLLRQSSGSRLAPPQLTVSSPSWAPPPQPFSRSNSNCGDGLDELISPTTNSPSPFYGGGGGDLIDEFHLHDQLSFLNEGGLKVADFYSEECRSPYQNLDWGQGHRRSCSVTDLCLNDPAGFGWRPCLYFARGYCKNGSSCRFVHGGLPDDPAKLDASGVEQHELLLRSKSLRLGGGAAASQLMASAAAFPYSPTGSLPQSPSSKCMNFLLQQQNDTQRAAALMLGEQEAHKFLSRSRSDFAGMVNPSSRQIYLTFPADSTFREEDVSNYFSIYGPVQDVRIPYQQKRMFGFVTFVYPETVKLILAKGNPHFVCDSRVLVKPYKEKGKVPDKYRKQGDFSGCSTPTGLDSPYDLQLGSRMLYGGSDVLLRRKLEEQQQAAELQQAIELQARRFMGLQLLDFKHRSLSMPHTHMATMAGATPAIPVDGRSGGGSSQSGSPPEDHSRCPVQHELLLQQSAVNGGDKEESAAQSRPNVDSDFQESMEHNLPDSPFASPTKSSMLSNLAVGEAEPVTGGSSATLSGNGGSGNPNHLMTSSLDMASFKSCFFEMPRFSSGHGAIGT